MCLHRGVKMAKKKMLGGMYPSPLWSKLCHDYEVGVYSNILIRWSNISSGDNCSCDQISDNKVRVYCIRHIFREGFIFARSGATREINNARKKYLPPIPTHECNLHTQCTCNVHDTVAFRAYETRLSKRLKKKVTIRHKVQFQCYFIIETNSNVRMYKSRSQPGLSIMLWKLECDKSPRESQITKLPENSKTSLFISAEKAAKLAF